MSIVGKTKTKFFMLIRNNIFWDYITFSEVLQSGTKKLGLQYFVVAGLETNGLKEIIYPLMHNVPKWLHILKILQFLV